MSDVTGASAPRAAGPAAERTDARAAAAPGSPSFGDVLSSLNPLQHIPVVGTLYRAITGDTIPDGARAAGSLAFSGLVFGPFGLLTSAATTVLGKLTGLDPDEMGRSMLRNVKPGDGSAQGDAAYPVAASPNDDAGTVLAAGAQSSLVAFAAVPLSAAPAAAVAAVPADSDGPRRVVPPAQLAAYGANRAPGGAPPRDDAGAADALNALELMRIGTPTAVAAAGGGRAPEAA